MKIKFIVAVNLLTVVMLSAFYVFQIIEVSEYDYQIRDYKQELIKLKESLTRLENVYASSSSLANLWPAINDLGFEEVEEIIYVSVEEQTFAAK